jgi:hypothetical protein
MFRLTLPKLVFLCFQVVVLVSSFSPFVFGVNENERSGKTIDVIRWKDVKSEAKFPKNVEIVNDDSEGAILKMTRSAADPQSTEIWTINHPKLNEKAYVLRGKVKYSGVHSAGYIEMWNHFPKPKEGAYFSRTMSETGAMGKLLGDSPWRDFELPFMISDETFPSPSKLQLNVFLPTSGTVWMSDLSLVEMSIADMQKSLSPLVPFTSFDWTTVAIVLTVLVVIALGVALGVWKFLSNRATRNRELRRMQALEIGL